MAFSVDVVVFFFAVSLRVVFILVKRPTTKSCDNITMYLICESSWTMAGGQDISQPCDIRFDSPFKLT